MTAEHTFKFVALNAIAPAHRTMRVFANGASAGLLTMRADDGEAAEFERRVLTQPRLVEALRACDAALSLQMLDGCTHEELNEARTTARAALKAAGASL